MNVSKNHLLATLLAFGGLGASAQTGQPDIELDTRWVETSLEVNATKRTPGSYTLVVRFSQLENTRQSPVYKTVLRGASQKLLTVTPVQPERPVGCSYTYSYVRGYRSPKLDSAFVYRLPYSTTKGEAVRALSLFNLNQRYFDGQPMRGWSAWEFRLAPGDTVFAMRKGQVVEVHDGEEPADEGVASTYRSRANSVLVEQPDGTLCRYEVLEKGSIAVRPGDMVYPGTPIARAGTYYERGEHQVRIAVYFPDENPNYRPGDPKNGAAFEWVYYAPRFATAQGDIRLQHGRAYRAVSSPELVQREMTKREIKQRTAK